MLQLTKEAPARNPYAAPAAKVPALGRVLPAQSEQTTKDVRTPSDAKPHPEPNPKVFKVAWVNKKIIADR